MLATSKDCESENVTVGFLGSFEVSDRDADMVNSVSTSENGRLRRVFSLFLSPYFRFDYQSEKKAAERPEQVVSSHYH